MHDMFDELQFWATDVITEPKELLESKEDSITNGMSDSEKRAYKLGLENAFSVTKQLLDQGLNNESIIFYNPDVKGTSEYTIEEIEDWLQK